MPFFMESLNDESVPFLSLQKVGHPEVGSVIGFAMEIYQLSDFLNTQNAIVVVKIWNLHDTHDGRFHRSYIVRFSVARL